MSDDLRRHVTVPLSDLAAVVRSKNAGPFQYTIDVLFPDAESYAAVERSGAVQPTAVASAYSVPLSTVTGVYFWETALALKVTLVRDVPAGSFGDNDCYGAQQHVPLMTLRIPTLRERPL